MMATWIGGMLLFVPIYLLAVSGTSSPRIWPMAFMAGMGCSYLAKHLMGWVWLRWNVLCLRGRLCARIQFRLEDTPPPGVLVEAHYICQRCGTEYLTHGWDREKVRA
jgi:hypothetical protein